MTVNELLERALHCSYRQQWDNALEYAQLAVEMAPDNFLAFKRLGLALWHSDRKEEAITMLKKSVELNPEFASAYYNLACFYANEGRKAEMLLHLQKAIDLDEFTDYREMAEEDVDFEGFLDDDDFLEIIGEARKESNKLAEILASGDYGVISQTILQLDQEIPVRAVGWEDYGDDSISELIKNNGVKVSEEALLHLFKVVTFNTSIDYFEGFSALLETLKAKRNGAFDDLLIQAWKGRYEYTDPGHLGSIDYQMLDSIKQLPVEKVAEIALWGLRSHGKDALSDYESLNAIALEKLPELHTLRTELVELIDSYLHGEIYQEEAFDVRQRRIRIALAPPPVEYDSSSGDSWAYEKAALAHFHPANVINAASRLVIQKDLVVVDLVKKDLQKICDFVVDPGLPAELRVSAVKDVIEKVGDKKAIGALTPALHDKSVKLLEVIGEVMHKSDVESKEVRVAVDYLIKEAEREGLDNYDLYDVICALRWFKDERVIEILLSALSKGNEAVRRETLKGLGIQKAVAAIPQIVMQLCEGSPQCVSAAAKCLHEIGGEAWQALEDKSNYEKVLSAAKKHPRWSTEALIYFRHERMNDDLVKLLKKNKEFDAFPYLSRGIAARATESDIPELIKIGLDRYQAENIGGRHFVEIFRSIARKGPVPAHEAVLGEVKQILSDCDKGDLRGFIADLKYDGKYANVSAPSEAERESARRFAEVYAQGLKMIDETQGLSEILFLGDSK
ncbi:hypothetical protein LVD17_14805 [Fulvivirga ulvae]|uniref:TPR end-of-group domain-containing protein n=1 Tax=Fulvivirga ulvae TaxID=2904245 RepID=UPI001F24817D|nr:tetratricopeptide repeat protein [Fulvivirga ulvae]UII29569.1 hypothetical protein LVD17_14805 [Fulvivirga ulvae]